MLDMPAKEQRHPLQARCLHPSQKVLRLSRNQRNGVHHMVSHGRFLKRPLSKPFFKTWRLNGALMEITLPLPRSL
jgi:hypothetical protein